MAVPLLAVEETKQRNSTVTEQPKKRVLTVTIKGSEETGAPATSLMQAVKEADWLTKKREAATLEPGKLHDSKECVENEQDGLHAKLRLAPLRAGEMRLRCQSRAKGCWPAAKECRETCSCLQKCMKVH